MESGMNRRPSGAMAVDPAFSARSTRGISLVTTDLGMITLAYQVFLRENPDGSGGVLARGQQDLIGAVVAPIYRVVVRNLY